MMVSEGTATAVMGKLWLWSAVRLADLRLFGGYCLR